jgi:adenine-specific DNA-methyltransferase
VYAVRDCLEVAVAGKPNALVLDFFAGSGTTLNALALLNAADSGSRRCVLVTNNEVEEKTANSLNADGLFVGDADYDKHGICMAVTIPRIKAALTGVNPAGRPVEGTYLDGRKCALGFDENAVFFDLAYDDPDVLDAGTHFDDVVPALWLAAGARGDPCSLKHDTDWLMPNGAPLAVLLDEDRLRPFLGALAKRPDITHVWLVTDSENAFARMRSRVSGGRPVGMLYRDYLRNFRINTRLAQ